MTYIKTFSLQNAQPTNTTLHTGEIQKTKEFNPVFYLWVPSRHCGMDMSSVHKPVQQKIAWGWGDVVMCFLSLLLTFSFPLFVKWGQ